MIARNLRDNGKTPLKQNVLFWSPSTTNKTPPNLVHWPNVHSCQFETRSKNEILNLSSLSFQRGDMEVMDMHTVTLVMLSLLFVSHDANINTAS